LIEHAFAARERFVGAATQVGKMMMMTASREKARGKLLRKKPMDEENPDFVLFALAEAKP
jgi:hypothetical protein